MPVSAYKKIPPVWEGFFALNDIHGSQLIQELCHIRGSFLSCDFILRQDGFTDLRLGLNARQQIQMNAPSSFMTNRPLES